MKSQIKKKMRGAGLANCVGKKKVGGQEGTGCKRQADPIFTESWLILTHKICIQRRLALEDDLIDPEVLVTILPEGLCPLGREICPCHLGLHESVHILAVEAPAAETRVTMMMKMKMLMMMMIMMLMMMMMTMMMMLMMIRYKGIACKAG